MTEILRSANPNDFPGLLALHIACIRGLASTKTYTPEELDSWVAYLENEGSDRYARYNNKVIVDVQDALRAFVSWSEDEAYSTASIECLYANRTDRGRGLAKMLLQDAEVAVNPEKTICVRSTLNARTFYEEQGYKYQGEALSRAGFRVALLEKRRQSV